MSRRIDGAYRCDRCDGDIENGGIELAVTISDLTKDKKGAIVNGMPRILHLCRANKCDTHVLTKRALAALDNIEQGNTK